MEKRIELINVDFGFQTSLVKKANAQLQDSEIAVLIGANGVGKSTLLQCLLKQKKLHSGEIKLMGKSLHSISITELAQILSIVYSKCQFSEHLKLFDLIALGKYHHYPYYFKLSRKDQLEVEKLISEFDLENCRMYPLNELSDGNLQKSFIARALAQDTPIILLDEPTTHLDDDNKTNIHEILSRVASRQKKTVVFSSHDWRSSNNISHYVWQIKNQEFQSYLFEDFYAQDLVSHTQDLVPFPIFFPRIIASESDMKIIISFLNKNLNRDLSGFSLTFKHPIFTLQDAANLHTFISWADFRNFII